MVDISHYATESDVYFETGITKETIMRVTGMNDSEVTTLINGFLKSAESRIRDALDIPHLVPRELHIGDGETTEFDLGPYDEEIYFDEEVEGCVEIVRACFFGRERRKLPYPKDCDEQTDDATKFGKGTGTTITNDDGKVQAGGYAIKIEFATNRYAYYPSTKDLNQPIDRFDFLSFRIECNTAGITFEFRLYNVDDNYNSAFFKLPKANKSYIINLDMEDNFNSNIDWNNENLYYWELRASGDCTVYLDNFNFNDGWFFTAPSGKLIICRKNIDVLTYEIDYTEDCPPCSGCRYYVTYTYDPFKVTVPENIKSATAQLAGVKLIDHLLGVRESATAFEFEGSTMELLGDRETLYARRGTLLADAKENLSSYGYGWSGTVVR